MIPFLASTIITLSLFFIFAYKKIEDLELLPKYFRFIGLIIIILNSLFISIEGLKDITLFLKGSSIIILIGFFLILFSKERNLSKISIWSKTSIFYISMSIFFLINEIIKTALNNQTDLINSQVVLSSIFSFILIYYIVESTIRNK